MPGKDHALTASRPLGRLANRGRRRISLTPDHIPASYLPPVAVDRYTTVVPAVWGMDGNDRVGDCTCADVDHEVKSMQAAALNQVVVSTTAEVLAAYSAVTGYDPADPSTDQGAEMQVVRDYWRKTGFVLGGKRHKILLFADLDVRDDNLIMWALDQFGAVGLGVNFPASAMDQFDNDQPWTVVDNSKIEGGHAVALVGYDAAWWYVLTWGRVQRVTPGWFNRYVEEAWTAFSEDFVNQRTGVTPLNATLYDLGVQFADVTGQPNPIPKPAPSPNPVPPAPADPDATFAAVLHPWVLKRHVGDNHRVAVAAKAWLAGKGL